MAERRNYVALQLVTREVEQSLKDARQALEAYVANTQDVSQLEACLAATHQVHGVLKMLEFNGAALLVRAAERMARDLLSQSVENVNAGLQALMEALLQLPLYVNRVKATGRDHPGKLLPLVNELRTVRGEKPLDEKALFFPRLQAAQVPNAKIPKANPDEFVALIKKMRQAYQSSMLGLIKGETIGNPGDVISKILQRLQSLSTDTASQPMWRIAEAVCEAIATGSLQDDQLVKQVLRLIDHEIKQLSDFGPAQLGKAPGEEVLRGLLYPLALCKDGTPRMQEVQAQYSLGSAQAMAITSDDAFDIALPDADALRAVVTALSEEMGLIKAVLERYARNETVSTDEWAGVGPVFDRILGAMHVLGLVEPRTVVQQQYDRLKPYIGGQPVEILVLSEVAAEMVAVEAALLQSRSLDEARHVRAVSYALKQAMETAVRETRGALERAKEAIATFIEKGHDPATLAGVPAMLGEVRGTLDLLAMPRASHIIASCQRFVASDLLQAGEQPAFATLDAMADALTSVEYYLERMAEEHDDYVELILDVGVDSVARLGYPLDRLEETLAAVRLRAEQAGEGAAAESPEDMADLVAEEETAAEPVAAVPPQAVPADAAGFVAGEIAEAELMKVEPAEVELAEVEPVEAELVEAEPVETPAVMQPAAGDDTAVPLVAGVAAAAPEEVDAEILEIFIEEAQEVIATINEYLPQWRANPDDKDALAELRRAYHTLKGSGRMVGAKDLGELAWSIENMLNRVIDGTVGYSDARGAMVARVTALAPGMVDAFSNGQTVDPDWLQVRIAEANQLASGDTVLAAPTAVAPAQPVAEPEAVEPEAIEPEVLEPEAVDLEAVDLEAFEPEAIELQPVAEEPAGMAFEAEPADGMVFELGDEEGAIEITAVPVAEPLEPAATVPPAVEEEPVDQELVDIFVGEASDHLAVLDAYVEQALAASGPVELSEDLRRALHTLKGSAHMADMKRIAAIATPLEKLVKEMLACQLQADSRVIEVLHDASEKMKSGVASLRHNGHDLIEGAEDFLAGLHQLHEEKHALITQRSEEGHTSTPEFIAQFLHLGMEHLMDASETLERWRAGEESGDILMRLRKELAILRDAAIRAELATVVDLCVGLESIYETVAHRADAVTDRFFQLAQEAQETLIDLMDFVAAGQNLPEVDRLLADLRQYVADIQASEPAEPAIEAMTLEAPAEVPEDTSTIRPVSSLIEFAEEPHSFFGEEEAAAEETAEAETAGEEIAEGAGFGAHEDSLSWLGAAEEPVAEEPVAEEPVAEEPVAEEPVAEEPVAEEPVAEEPVAEEPVAEAVDPEILEIFFEEAAELLEAIDASVNGWLGERDKRSHLEELKRQLHTIKGSARLAGIRVLGDVSHEFETFVIASEHQPAAWDDAFFAVLLRYLDQLVALVAAAQRGETLRAVDIAALEAGAAVPPTEAAPAMAAPAAQAEAEAATEVPVPVEAAGVAAEVPAIVAEEEDEEAETVDEEVLEIFLEEARELIDGIDASIRAWLDKRDDRRPLEELKRLLHTLKGGARLAGLRRLGDVSHDMETLIISREHAPKDWTDAFFEQVQQFHDRLNALMDKVTAAPAAPQAALHEAPPQEVPEEPAAAEKPVVVPMARPAPKVVDNVVPFVARDVRVGQVPPPPSRLRAAIAARSQGAVAQEAVRVSAELLEGLVNLAGETSISRARIEEQINEFGRSLHEMEATIDRLVDQLRRLDIETQAQISFRQEQLEVEGREEFDPLEMDRFSMLQQLSRSLFESSHDIHDITGGLFDKTRDMETLLLQQSRINTELQEGLMQSQMVPFERMVPKLRRIARQVSGELKKQVDFQVLNAEGEMDRTMLERMTAPLEHMLRNAIDHGLEDTAGRKVAGKSPTGTITLALTREGSEVVITLTDDGKGINLAAVRKKAIEKGLMAENASLTDHEIVQFIMSAGFSTAERITQISGRGVGMDVVASEIKQLGGSVDIHTVAGKGTRFEIRLPFTMSVNRALMVAIGDDHYAIPLNTIEGIVRVSPYELEAYYQPDAPPFEYAGQQYGLRYMGTLLGTQERPSMEGFTMPLPVLLVRGSEHAVAIQVDRLLGSREIVVKTLGRQFALVQGLSGATVLGDGSVVVILDLIAMIRADFMRGQREQDARQTDAQIEDARVRTVMVVDDSVTVRKVTSRFLEREGYEVRTAKDGLDAVTQLQDFIPDIMLLDIEMPRMDGFEVASRVRHDSRLKNLPIIMITSRTGEKHRERAMSLGVNRYLGKPYQEADLLSNIEELLGKKKG